MDDLQRVRFGGGAGTLTQSVQIWPEADKQCVVICMNGERTL